MNMRSTLLFALTVICSLFVQDILAQTPEFAKEDGTGNSTFLMGSTSARKVQIFYDPIDFVPAPPSGSIDTLYFQYGSTGNTSDQTLTNFLIRLGHSNTSGYPNGNEFYDANMDTVLFDTSYFQVGGTTEQWFAIPLQQTFLYDNTKTLILETSFDAATITNWGTSTSSPGGRKLYSSTRTATTGTTTSTSFQDMGFSLAPSGPDEAGISGLASPGATCGGNEDVIVVLTNFGSNRLDSVMINWEFNGAPQAPVNVTDTLGLSQSTQVTLGTVNIPAASSFTIKAWTTMPNGVADTVNSNDTIFISSQTSLNGTYTVGGTAPDFASLSAAANALNNVGVCGPVVFDIASGTYVDSVTINEVAGASSTNTITIQGVDKDSVTITYDGANQWGTIQLVGADYLTIRNMTIESTASTDAAGILFTMGADNNTVEGCRLLVDTLGTTYTDLFPVLFSGAMPTTFPNDGNAGNYNWFNNNCFFGGENGLEIQGGTGGDDNFGNVVTNNLFRMIDENAIYTEDIDSFIVKDNIIKDMNISANTDGIYNLDMGYFIISGNQVTVPDWGIYVEDANQFTVTSNINARAKMFNNFSISNADYAIYILDGDSIDVWHNSAYGAPGMRIDGSAAGVDVRNNIFVSNDDYAFEDDDASPTTRYLALDYNIYHVVNDTITVRLGGTTGFDYTNLGDLQVAHPGLNTNSIFGDPLFLSPLDLHVVGPLANNVGDNSVGITVDIDGETRPLAPAVTVDIGADEFFIAANDVGVVSVDVAAPLCPGVNDVPVTILNFGLNANDSVTVKWSVNGVAQPDFQFLGVLASAEDTAFTIGTFDFEVDSVYEILAWTITPNGVSDDDQTNDTAFVSNLQTALRGVYSVGGVSPDYANPTDAAIALNTYGVCGDVVFNIADGTYDGPVFLDQVVGVSDTATITFEGTGMDNVLVTDSSSSAWGTFVMNLTNYVTIRKMTIETRASTDGACVQLVDASWSKVDSCRLLMDTTLTSSIDLIGVMLSGSLTSDATAGICNHNFITNNYIYGGEYGIEMQAALNSSNKGNHVLNNKILQSDDAAFFGDYQDSIFIRNNYVRGMKASTAVGIETDDFGFFMVTGNDIIANDYGIDINDANQFGTTTDISARAKIVNNFVISEGSGSDDAINLVDSDSIDIWHNTAVGYTGMKAETLCDGLDVRNNIFVTDGRSLTISFAFEDDDASPTRYIALDYNLYFAPLGVNVAEFNNGADFATLADWQAAFPQYNQNSIFDDPLFVSPTDLHVLSAIANDVGDNTVGVTVDIDGETRPFPGSTIVDIGADEYDLPKADAGINSLVFPNGVCPGSAEIEVTLFNFGLDTIKNVNLMWSINDTMQTPLVLSGVTVPPVEDTTLIIGTYNFMSGVTYEVKTWSNTPNGFLDGDNSNDTSTISGLKVGLAGGIYTIGFLGADFLTPLDAKNVVDSFGICGPVEFQLAANTYPGTITLDPVVGANAINTITINGMHKDSVKVTYDANAPWWGTILFNGGDHYILKNMTIETSASTDGACVQFFNDADHNVIDSCRLLMDTTASAPFDLIGAMFSGSLTSDDTEGNAGSFNTISNSCILGGEYGIRIEGNATSAQNRGNQYINNIFDGNYDYAAYTDNADSLIIRDNYVRNIKNATNGDGFYNLDVGFFMITGNDIIAPDWGIYVEDANQFGITSATNQRAKIVNNFIISTSDNALIISDGDSIDVWHNSLQGEPGMEATATCEGLDVRNNIFSSNADFAFQDNNDNPDTRYLALDNNVYYSPAGFLARFGGTAGFDYINLTQFKVAWPTFNINSLQGNPIFAGPEDLHVVSSLSNDVGDNSVGITVDIDGETRPFAGSTTVDIGADEFNPPANNLTVESIEFPDGLCSGSSRIVVTFTNIGSDTLDSYTYNILVDGNSVASGTETNVALLPGRRTQFPATTTSFGNGPIEVVAYTSLPNGSPDASPSDDTLTVSGLYPGLAGGTYTVGGATPDFATIADAADSINQAGICGPVVFAIRPGTYTEQIVVEEIVGASSTNTITFTSETGDSTSVDVTWPTTSSSTDPNYVFFLDGADWVTIEKITVTRTGISTYGRGIALLNGANNNTIQNNMIEVGETTTSSTTAESHAHIWSGETRDDRTTIQNNYFYFGSMGVFLQGDFLETGHIIRNNFFDDMNIRAIKIEDGLAPTITENTITTLSTSTSYYAIEFLDVNNDFKITKNVIRDGRGRGIYISSCAATQARPALIANNFIEVGGTSIAYGIYSLNSTFQNIYHNNINITSTSSTSGRAMYLSGVAASDVKMVNNNFVNTGGGYTYYIPSSGTSAVALSNYNNLYTTGSSIGYWSSAIGGAALSDWQTASNSDFNSVAVDPGYTSATDLHVSEPAIFKAGTPLISVTTDIDNEARDANNPDIGADEFLLADNLEATTVFAPADGSCASDAATVSVIVTNNGLNPQDTIVVTVEVLGAVTANYVDTLYGPLAPGTSDTLVFAQTLDNTTPGVYSLKATVTIAGDQFNGDDQVTVVRSFNAPPSVDLGNDSTLCTDQLVSLDAGAGFIYDWSNGETTQTIDAVAPGTYSVEITDLNGCTATDTVVLTGLALPETGIEDTSICDGGSVTFDASGDPTIASYLWSDGTTNATLDADTAGAYAVTLTGNNGCTVTKSVTLTVNDLPVVDLGPDTAIVLGTTYTLDAGAGFASYSWSDGSTGQTLALTAADTVSVTVLDTNGCSASDEVEVTFFVGVEELAFLGDVKVYPNPFSDEFTVNFTLVDEVEFMDISILDVTGKELRVENFSNFSGGLSRTYDLSKHSVGLYILRVTTNEGNYYHKVVKQ